MKGFKSSLKVLLKLSLVILLSIIFDLRLIEKANASDITANFMGHVSDIAPNVWTPLDNIGDAGNLIHSAVSIESWNESRTVMEFDLGSFNSTSIASASLTLPDVFFHVCCGSPYPSNTAVQLFSYVGNGGYVTDYSEYQIAGTNLGALDTSSIPVWNGIGPVDIPFGDTITIDVTQTVQSFINNSNDFIGFRIQANDPPMSTSWVMRVADNGTTGIRTLPTLNITAVPEPVSTTLFIVGGSFFGVRAYWRKRKIRTTTAWR